MRIDNDYLLIIKSSALGEGEIDLGSKLMGSFLTMVLESGRIPEKLIFFNSGIYLTTEGSPVADTLKGFIEAGARVLTCGTCLDYYDRKEKLVIGEATNMKDTVDAINSHGKVVIV